MGKIAGENHADAIGLGRHIVARPRVVRLLEESDAPVRILAAPAGYGKTTAALQWLAAAKRSIAWYQATPASTDIAALASGLGIAISDLNPGVETVVSEQLQARREGEIDADRLANAIAGELSDWPSNCWLVIDDYHYLMDAPASERFVERLTRARALRLLLISRRRPNWLTARQLLYGEVCELGVHALAMTPDEASLVLESTRAEAASGLVALAQGWPAVIGLAALTGGSLTGLENQLPEALHSYFAEELYQAAPPNLQEELLQISLVPTITPRLADGLAPDGGRLLQEAVQFGFLIPLGETRFDLHPLLRQFLLAKAKARPDEMDRWCDRISQLLARESHWDDLFSLLGVNPSPRGFDVLVEGALDQFLNDGRVETVRKWVNQAKASGIESPLLDLAAAEVLFREGQHREAEDFALKAAETLALKHPLRSRALFRAAQSAQLDNRAAIAIRRHEEAAKAALNAHDRRNAIWGQFVAHVELDDYENALKAVSQYEQTSSIDDNDRLRQAQGRISIAIRWRGIREALERCRQCLSLLDERADPLIQTGLAHRVASAFALAADYEEALRLAALEETIATRVGLDFVIPHVWITRATAYIGRGEFRVARKWLTDARARADALGDDHSRINSTMLDAKIMLAQLNTRQACETLAQNWNEWPTRALGSEYLAMQALAHACAGDQEQAAVKAENSAALSSQLEPKVLRMWALAIARHHLEPGTTHLVDAFDRTYDIGHIDGIVLAFRAYPPVLPTLVQSSRLVPRLKEVMEAAGDFAHARRVGIRLTGSQPEIPRLLTKREMDVIALLHDGLSNAQIAQALWISESTAKVHVRHILRKLGVRSRTEAALLAGPYLR
jgi:DNA-binding CsgD family transcriptional regulator